MKERPIIFSVTTGQPSQRGKRLKAADGLTWKQRNRDAVSGLSSPTRWAGFPEGGFEDRTKENSND